MKNRKLYISLGVLLIILVSLSSYFVMKNDLNILFNKHPNMNEPSDTTQLEQCPCCDYFSLPERNNYLICPICFWEDDGQDLDELDIESGPNHITLREGRNNFLKYGACDPQSVKSVIPKEERKRFDYKKRNPDDFKQRPTDPDFKIKEAETLCKGLEKRVKKLEIKLKEETNREQIQKLQNEIEMVKKNIDFTKDYINKLSDNKKDVLNPPSSGK